MEKVEREEIREFRTMVNGRCLFLSVILLLSFFIFGKICFPEVPEEVWQESEFWVGLASGSIVPLSSLMAALHDRVLGLFERGWPESKKTKGERSCLYLIAVFLLCVVGLIVDFFVWTKGSTMALTGLGTALIVELALLGIVRYTIAFFREG